MVLEGFSDFIVFRVVLTGFRMVGTAESPLKRPL